MLEHSKNRMAERLPKKFSSKGIRKTRGTPLKKRWHEMGDKERKAFSQPFPLAKSFYFDKECKSALFKFQYKNHLEGTSHLQ